MLSALTRRWLVQAARLPAAMLLAVGLSASVAEATCGDYLISHDDSTATHEMSPSGSSESLPGVPRCSGPFCSRGPFEPIPADPVHLEVEVGRFAQLSSPRDDVALTSQDRLCHPNGLPVPFTIADRLDRPPRLHAWIA
ncbi:MAG: hypothetical protein KF777_04720 [Planctomycetaceae bacterium]|nr:hypothetical protein [Planctomycetaceae bacterium]